MTRGERERVHCSHQRVQQWIVSRRGLTQTHGEGTLVPLMFDEFVRFVEETA